MEIPAHRNMVDLNKAWVIKWKKASEVDFIEMANIIIAICLRVERAIIFFKSCSQLADMLEYNAVILEDSINIEIDKGWILFMVRINKNTPAVTKVDEWTKAEIGVGAAIADGSHAENGNCALFEKAAIIKSVIEISWNSSFILKFQLEFIIRILIDIKIIMSPIRFDIMVIDPDAAVEKFW